MQIKRRTQLNVALSVLTALVICLIFFLALHRVNRAMEAANIADEITTSVFERSTLREDYLRTDSERAKEQWFARQEQVGRLLKAAAEKFTDAEDKSVVAELSKNHESIGKLFAAIVENRAQVGSGTVSAALSQEIEDRLLTQLTMRLYKVTLGTRKLQEAGEELVLAALRQAGGGIACVLAIIIAAELLNSWTMNRAIADRIGRLRDGATVIGGGDLVHRIDIKGDDEFVELSGAFNAMTSKLRGSYQDLEREIEERKRAEEALRKTHDELELRVQELRREAMEREQAEEALRQAKEVAEAANRAKSEFLARMSHELRTPMTVIMGTVQNMLESGPAQEQRKLLEMADTSAHRLLGVIDDILDITAVETKRLKIEERPFDLRAIVREAAEMFIRPAREKGLDLRWEVAPQVPAQVVGDPGRLGQVLINLIGNAVKFTEKGEVTLAVTGTESGAEFTIRDSGIGIPPEKLDRIFEPFNQVDSSLSRRYGGTGLGLAICRELVGLMGGVIRGESEFGRGSVFSFTLPLRPAVSIVPAAEPANVIQEVMSPGRILLAEDEPMVRDLVVLILRRQGWEVTVVGNGSQAVAQWKDGQFDLVLMDIQMPEMDGLEATRLIRHLEKEQGKRTRIFALTAHARPENRKECLAAGMDGFLTKPFRIEALHSMIQNCPGDLSPPGGAAPAG